MGNSAHYFKRVTVRGSNFSSLLKRFFKRFLIINFLFVCKLIPVRVFPISAQHSDGFVKVQGVEFPLSMQIFLKNFSLLYCMTSNNFLEVIATIEYFHWFGLKYCVKLGVSSWDIPVSIYNFRYNRIYYW